VTAQSPDDASAPAVTAVILCGGRGERLRPFTELLPKSLVPIGDRPLLGHLMDYLATRGVRRFVLCTGYKKEAIESFAAGLAPSGWQIECVDSGDAPMIDRLLDALPHVIGRALVCYGDTLANVDLAALTAAHERGDASATVTVHPLESPFGIVQADADGFVESIREKPRLPHWINIGFVLCDREAFGSAERGMDLVGFLDTLVRSRRLRAYRHEGRHLTVNTEKERSAAEKDIVFFTYPEGNPLK
jgi:NDP-sugar pyrophosphorylase family protein